MHPSSDSSLVVGLSNPAYQCGGGPQAFYDRVKQSIEGRGHTVVTGSDEELYQAGSLDVLIGIETDFPGLPDELKGKTRVIDWGPLANKAHTVKGYLDRLEGIQVIGHYAGLNPMYVAERIYHWDDDRDPPVADYVGQLHHSVALTLDDVSKQDVENAKGKSNKTISVLFGGAPPSWMEEHIRRVVAGVARIDADIEVYHGAMSHEQQRLFDPLEGKATFFSQLPHE
ncbi:MAG: hypothetical protein ACTSWQ_08645, partial [Candidatus Thorarchaeota archaeon]